MKFNIDDFEKSRIICLDTETTGLTDADEILQLSIVNGNKEVLFNEKIKPSHMQEWPEAERVNHISPEMVKDMKPFSAYRKQVSDIIIGADLIVGYNLNFDLKCVKREYWKTEDYGRIKGTLDNIKKYDVMKAYAPICGEWNERFGDYKWQKLTTCADALGYDWDAGGAPHDSLGDALATLYCFEKIAGSDLSLEKGKKDFEESFEERYGVNRETYDVELQIDADEGSHNEIINSVAEKSLNNSYEQDGQRIYRFNEAFRDSISEIVYDYTTDELRNTLLEDALDQVDWADVAGCYQDELEEALSSILSDRSGLKEDRGSVLKKLEETPARSEKAEEPAGRKTKEVER